MSFYVKYYKLEQNGLLRYRTKWATIYNILFWITSYLLNDPPTLEGRICKLASSFLSDVYTRLISSV